MFEQTKALCDLFLKMGIPGFDLVVYRDGACILRHMGGYADPEKKIPIRGKEKYHVYSISKLFTCAAAMQLWEKGLFSLDDKLSDYMPAFRDMTVKTETGIQKAKNPILIRHLFEMTSGINYDLHTPALEQYYQDCKGRCPTLELVQHIAESPLEFEPGESWMYGLSHDVLAALVEQLSGQKFEEYVRDHIFLPLGMVNSDFLHPMEDWEGFARMFRYEAATQQYEPRWSTIYRPGPEYASGGAGCVSTVEDCIRFLEAMRVGDVILKKDTIAMMAVNRLTEEQIKLTGTNGYGLGMRASKAEDPVKEFGWGGAAGAFASVDPVNNISIYYAQHVLASPNRSLRPWLYRTVRADLLGQKIRIPIEETDDNPSLTY